MTEKPAEGVQGFLLYNPFTDRHWFRVYHDEPDPDTGRKRYTDYELHAEDIKVQILAGGLSLFHDGTKGKLDWSSRLFDKTDLSG